MLQGDPPSHIALFVCHGLPLLDENELTLKVTANAEYVVPIASRDESDSEGCLVQTRV